MNLIIAVVEMNFADVVEIVVIEAVFRAVEDAADVVVSGTSGGNTSTLLKDEKGTLRNRKVFLIIIR